jgi:hypothetical protein
MCVFGEEGDACVSGIPEEGEEVFNKCTGEKKLFVSEQAQISQPPGLMQRCR